MSAKVTITWEGLDEVLSNLTDIGKQAPDRLQKQVQALAEDTETAWKDDTPRRTGRMQEADRTDVAGLSFTLNNDTYYYDFVDKGHWTPRGWRTKHGYRPAKHRSHVEGREFTAVAIEFIKDNIEEYLSKFLD